MADCVHSIMYSVDRRNTHKTMSLSARVCTLVLLILVPTTCAFPSGAPKAACGSMIPGHVDTRAQTTVSPYSLQLERGIITYTPGQTLKVCVMGKTFKGILLQMREVEGTVPVGTFTTDLPSNTKLTTCSASGDSVTHSNTNNKADSTCFVWNSPEKVDGDLVFVATIAQKRQVYWVKITSGVIKSSLNTDSADNTDTTAPSSSKNGAIALGIMFATFAVCALLAAAAHLLE